MADVTLIAPRSRSDRRSAAAGIAAEARAGAELRASILLFVYGFILFTVYLSFTDSQDAARSYDWVGFEQLRAAVRRMPNWWIALEQPGDLRHALHRHLHRARPRLAILLDQKIRGEGVLRPIYLYPMALSFIVTGTAWKWFLDPGIGLEHDDAAAGAGRASPSTGSRTARWRSTRRHRGGLAVLRLRHGDVPGRPARHRRRDHQGGADRRRLDLHALPPHHHPAAAAGLPVGLRRARPPGDQVLRPGDRADRRRARARRPGLPATFMYPTPSPATRWASARPAR